MNHPAQFPSASLAAFAPDEADQRVWMESLETVSLAAGEVLFRESDAADAMFLIESGVLVVVLEVAGAGRSEPRRRRWRWRWRERCPAGGGAESEPSGLIKSRKQAQFNGISIIPLRAASSLFHGR